MSRVQKLEQIAALAAELKAGEQDREPYVRPNEELRGRLRAKLRPGAGLLTRTVYGILGGTLNLDTMNSLLADGFRDYIRVEASKYAVAEREALRARVKELESEVQASKEAPADLSAMALAELVLEHLADAEPPARDCRCHISPPCSDCVDHGPAREVFDMAREILSSKPSVAEIPQPGEDAVGERVNFCAQGMVREEARKVEVFAADGTSRGTATFLHWGVDFEELPGGIGNVTMAVVEWPDGKVAMEYPPYLRFVKDEAPRSGVAL